MNQVSLSLSFCRHTKAQLYVTCIHSMYSRYMFDINYLIMLVHFFSPVPGSLNSCRRSRYQELNASIRSTHPFRCGEAP